MILFYQALIKLTLLDSKVLLIQGLLIMAMHYWINLMKEKKLLEIEMVKLWKMLSPPIVCIYVNTLNIFIVY